MDIGLWILLPVAAYVTILGVAQLKARHTRRAQAKQQRIENDRVLQASDVEDEWSRVSPDGKPDWGRV